MKTVSLNGIFEMYSQDKEFCCKAEIPGSDIGNLIKNGIIKNPAEVTDGEELACKIARKDFVFEREFILDAALTECENAVLYFEKLDTLCSVFLNGTKLFSAENAHISYSYDVKNIIKAGKNILKLAFSSPLEYIEKKQRNRAMPPNVNGVNGAMYLRKPNCSFGWDWGPCIPYNYVGKTEVRFFNSEIKNIKISQNTEKDLSVVTVSAENAEVCVILTPSSEKLMPEKNAEGSFVFNIKNPELWYTRDLSEKETQPLYTVLLKNGEMTAERKIGLRSVKLVREKDEYGENFFFEVNGKRIFAKGANVIPFAAIPEYGGDESAEYYIKLAAKSNFNIIRIWGGGEYASDALLDFCDELGILVWQDFLFACMMYPLDEPDFLHNAVLEAEYNINRMSYRACLALFCGNNEIEEMNAAFVNLKSLRAAYVKFFYHILPETVKRLCDTDYIPTSPVGKAPFKGNSDENIGDCHMWAVWHGLLPSDWYGTRYARFLSEFGMESLPSLRAVEKFAPGETDVYSKPFMQHQKCADGNRKLMYYLCESFGSDVDFAVLPYLTGIMQAECIKAASEHFRRNKGRCNGSVFWQFNDVWCAPSWSAVDFEKVPKALMYKARDFFAPLAVSYSDGKVYIINDTLYDKNIKAELKKYHGGRLRWQCEKQILSRADSVSVLCEIGLFENELLRVDVNGRTYWFDNALKLEKANITVKKEEDTVTLCSDTFAKNVCLESDGDIIADENYFFLAPGEAKTVKISGGQGGFRVLCENNIVFGGSAAKTNAFRLFYRLKPMNILSYLWHSLK